MTQRDKLRQRMEQNPQNVRFEDLDNLLRSYGFQLRRSSGSHHIYLKGQFKIVVPYRRPHVLPVYVHLVLVTLRAMEKQEQEQTDGQES